MKSGKHPPSATQPPHSKEKGGHQFRPAHHVDSWHQPGQFRILAEGSHPLPQIALAGRSNAGKSSLVNRLLGPAMAKVSKTPGKTRALEVFFSSLPTIFVDLPGYGFASRSQQERQKWGALIQVYLETMPTLKGIVLIVDARHEPFENDLQMVRWVESRGLNGVILLNKWDAATQSEREKVRRAWEARVDVLTWPVLPFSCKTGLGAQQLEGILKQWVFDGRAL